MGDHLRSNQAIPAPGRRALFWTAVTNAEAKNLEAISKAIDQHNSNCPFPASEVRMNPFEVERLGWEEILGLPITPDPALGTGAFRIICARDGEGDELEEVEAVGELIEIGGPEPEGPPV
jgi:hypothetical protein